MVLLPVAAFLAAPAGASSQTPGANLAGLSSSATATALRVQPLTPGFVGAGNVALGNLIEADIPYASSTSSTGPTNAGTATPVYPGPIASDLGTVFETFAPIPPTFVNLLNDPVLARSTYPAQATTKSSSSYAPPTGAAAGVGTASTTSTDSGTTATAAVNDTSVLGTGSTTLSIPVVGGLLSGLLQQLHLSGPLLDVASSTATTESSVGASSLTATARTDVGRISLLFGAIQIAGIDSAASATSNGTTASQTNSLKMASVTVLGHAASIGPDGLSIDGASQGGPLAGLLNQILVALQQAGLTVNTVAPTEQVQGNAASVTSGALHIGFIDPNLPNPNGISPLHTVGLNLDLGQAEASSNATAVPPFAPLPGTAVRPSPTAQSTGGASSISTPGSAGVSGTPASYVPGTPGQVQTVGGTPASSGSGPSTAGLPNTGASNPSSSGPSTGALKPLGFMGLPVKVSWVVLAFLLSLVGAGPLLAYANWQLLRGRSP
jgi:hypothetical protein